MSLDGLHIHVDPAYAFLKADLGMLPETFQFLDRVLHDGRNQIRMGRLGTEGPEVVVKRYRRPIWIQRMVYTYIRKSKALRGFLYAQRYLEKGLLTPGPVGSVEVVRKGLLEDMYLLTLPGYKDSLKTALEADPSNGLLLDTLADFLFRMHSSGIIHNDLNLSNFLFDKDRFLSDPVIEVIDINRTRFVSHPSKTRCLRDLCRLTHDRKLLETIVRRYAALRKWDVSFCLDEVFRALDALERKEEMKRRMRKS